MLCYALLFLCYVMYCTAAQCSAVFFVQFPHISLSIPRYTVQDFWTITGGTAYFETTVPLLIESCTHFELERLVGTRDTHHHYGRPE